VSTLERENRVRIWPFEVVSDHIPLCGDARSVLAQPSEHNLFVNNPLLSIYLHAGGANAIYYDLVAKDEGNFPISKSALRLLFLERRWYWLGVL
jgi:hypothetical protein